MNANENIITFDTSQMHVLLGFLIALGLVWLGTYARKWGKTMKHWEREEYLQRLVNDALTDALEDAYYNGMISKQEKRNINRRFAAVTKSKDLLPKSPRVLKEEIKQRMGKNGSAVEIPGEQPPKEVVKNSLKQKSAFGQALFRHSIP